MALTYNNSMQVIKMTATNDVITGLQNIESILISSTAGGEFIIGDVTGEELFRLTTAAGELTKQINVNRQIFGIKGVAIPNGTVHIFLSKK